jgi:hypothetical protein
MTSRPDRTCRDVRRELVAALLEAPGLDPLPGRLAGHLGACRGCAAYRQHLLEATSSFPPEGAYRPRLRARTLAAAERDRECAWPGLWLWLPPGAAACALAAYGLPTWVLTKTLGSVLGSPGLGLAAALPVIGSLLVLLPATLAVSLLRRTPTLNGPQPSETKGAPS